MAKSIEVLIIVEAEIATTRIVERVVATCAVHGIRYSKRLLADLNEEDFAADKLPLFIRCADPLSVVWMRALAEADRGYAYYIDDNFWHIGGTSEIADYYRHPVVRSSLEYAVRNARIVITSSHELAQFLQRFTKRVALLPAPFDFSLVQGIDVPPTDEIRIGFAGSTSRVDDLELIAPVIASTLERLPSVVFEFAGAMPRGVSIGDRVRFFPYVGDYELYVRFQQQRNWAIGLAPLIDNVANRCKTDNKYREYSGCKIAGIFSDIPPYSEVIEDRVTGLLVDDRASSWLHAINELVSDAELRSKIASHAYNDVRNRCDLDRVAEQWSILFRSLYTRRPLTSRMLRPALRGTAHTWARVQSWRLQLAMAHQAGGSSLVAKRIAGRLMRALPRMVRQK